MNPSEVSSNTQAWLNFKGSEWQKRIDVRDFIQQNYLPYTGDDSFLAPATERTRQLWVEISVLIEQERIKGVLDVSSEVGTSITAHKPGYINQNLELIVGLQTDAPLKRAIVPNGGLRMVEAGLQAYGFELDASVKEAYQRYRKDHNQGVFDVYSPDILACRRSGIITGLPDAYGRGRIVGDYRRVALYGVDFLITDKKREKAELDSAAFSEDILRTREEMSEQIRALDELKQMAASYGFDIGRAATTAQEAVQWTYFGYLAAIKEQNGAAMSIGRISTFLDIYIQRDIDAGQLDESSAQELIDDLVTAKFFPGETDQRFLGIFVRRHAGNPHQVAVAFQAKFVAQTGTRQINFPIEFCRECGFIRHWFAGNDRDWCARESVRANARNAIFYAAQAFYFGQRIQCPLVVFLVWCQPGYDNIATVNLKAGPIQVSSAQRALAARPQIVFD